MRSLSPTTNSVDPSGERMTHARLLSIDALRGFDMFWIVGGDALVSTWLRATKTSWGVTLSQQLEHVDWEGFRFYDLIFPLFLFLVGCVLPFSLEKYRAEPSAMYGRILRRTALLFLLGLINNGLLQFQWPIRIAGVLQRIAICYGLTGLIVLHTRWRGRIAIVVAILLGYWAILSWIPAPGGTAGDLSKQGNLAGYIDRTFLPGKILEPYYGFGDNEGLLSTIPAIATTLLGVLAGTWLRSPVRPWSKVGGLAIVGLACLAGGHLWSGYFPIIKNLWTSSYVLLAGGWSFLLLALFYAIIDVLEWRMGAWFWIVIGANAITIYVAQRFIDFAKIGQFFFGGVARLSGDWSTVVLLASTLLAKWLFLWYLYRNRVFLRV